MLRTVFHKLFFLVVAFAIATSSVVSAARMAPEAQVDPALAAYLSVGGTWAELCGDGTQGGEHRCEYCNLVADVPEVSCTDRIEKLAFDGRIQTHSDLVLGAYLSHSNVSARAPPALG